MTRRKKTSSRGQSDDPLSWVRETAQPAGASSPSGPQVTETKALPAATTAAAFENNGPIVLDPVITIAEAAALKDRLLHYSNRKGEVRVDGSRVESVDTASLQVLLAFVRTLQGHGANVSWTGVSAALLNTAQLLGVAGQLGLRT